MHARELIALALPTPPPTLPQYSVAELAELGELAMQHSVLPAVLRHLPALGAQWQAVHLQTVGRGMLLRLWQDKVLAGLRQAGLTVLVLKGTEFADRLYPDPSLRWFTDIDLLVDQSAVEQSGQVLAQLGFDHHRGAHLRHQQPYGEEMWQSRTTPKFAVEIHWNLVNSPAVQRGLNVRRADLQVGADGRLSASALLVIAAVHAAASHVFDRLGLLVDLHLAATGAAGPLDEDYLVATAQRTGARLALRTGLDLAWRLWGHPECARWRDRLPARPTDALALRLISPSVILGRHNRLAELRRRLYRELLKRS